MTYIAKPKVHHPSLKKNALGLTRRDYEGAITTLCAGCGHDSITAAIVQAFWELDAPIGRVCSEEVPIPYPRHLENAALPQAPKIVAAAKAALGRA